MESEPVVSKVNETDANNVEVYDEEKTEPSKKEFKFTALGEIMMGGVIKDKVAYNYMSAFKSLTDVLKDSDYTVANLTTNITSLDKIENPKSKYIVTKKILNALSVLGVDGVNISSDHMLDFGKDVFTETKNILKEDALDVIGLQDSIVYAEHDGIKVAIIGVCNEVIGVQTDYANSEIMTYNLEKIKSMISEAKNNSNTVIVMTHLGLENSYQVTEIMSWFYKELINSGADMVLGAHALGVYPIEIYKGKPIIYSLGYLMHDTDYAAGKKSGVFNFTIDVDGKITKLEFIPTYINAKKQTILCTDYNKEEAEKFLKTLQKTGVNSNISDGKLIVNFN